MTTMISINKWCIFDIKQIGVAGEADDEDDYGSETFLYGSVRLGNRNGGRVLSQPS
jgi:hypothetical protein